MTQHASQLPSALLCTPDGCRYGGQPADTWQVNDLAGLHALPTRLHRWQQQNPGGDACGIISYDAGLALHGIAPAPAETPLALINLYSLESIGYCTAPDDLPAPGPDTRFALQSPFTAGVRDQDYLHAIRCIHDYEHRGDCYQINFARQFSAQASGHPFAAFRRLYAQHPAPWASYIQLPEGAVFGVSPECFLRSRGAQLVTHPIKGSRPRGDTPDKDKAIATELLGSAKDRAENLMIVDLLRNDLGRVCTPGSVSTPDLFALQRFSNVQHLVSTVTATLKPGVLPLEALISAFPGGSITGAPKKRAMEIINELETFNRGFYCGTQFWLDANGDMDANILIRTFQWFGSQLLCHGGGGIVVDSDPGAELAESDFKVRALMEALQRS